MGNKVRLPFTEIFERAAKLAREDSQNVEHKYKGLLNDIYTKKLPRLFDWRPLLRNSSIQCSIYYNTGTVTISASSTSLTGSGTTWTSGMTATNGYKIKFNGNDNIYTFTYASATTATISPALSGSTDISAGSYELFRDTYSLASDFDRFLINGGLEYNRAGQPDIIRSTSEDEWKKDFQAQSQDIPCRMRVLGTEDSNGYKQVQINPPPKKATLLPYDYIMKLTPMTEYTTGYITTLANGGTAVTGSGTDFDGYIQTGYTYYFRIDSDGTGDESVWYQVASAGSNTALTLSDAYGGTAISSGTSSYTISMVPQLPSEFHDVLLSWLTAASIADQDNPMYQFYISMGQRGIDELKTIHKTRTYNKVPDTDIDIR